MNNMRLLRQLITIASLILSVTANADPASPGISADLQGGFSSLAVKLEGEGFASDLMADQGMTYGADFGYGWNSGFRLHLKYSQAEGQFDPSTLVTPATVDGKRTEYRLYGIMAPFEDTAFKGLRIGMGYSLVNYEVVANSPAVITEQHSQGVSLLAEHDITFSEKWYASVKGLIYLPHNFNEKTAVTGYNPKYFGRELGLHLNWKLQEDLRIYLAVSYRQDVVHFDGTGTRGVSGATDTRTTILYPIGVRFDF